MMAELLMREAYDTTFDIFDHVKQANLERKTSSPDVKRPLRLVEYHPAEDTFGAMRLEELATTFVNLKIGEKFHLSFSDYLDFPRAIIDVLNRVADKRVTSDDRTIAAAMRNLDSASGSK